MWYQEKNYFDDSLEYYARLNVLIQPLLNKLSHYLHEQKNGLIVIWGNDYSQYSVRLKGWLVSFCYLQLFMQCWDNKKLSIAPHLDNVKYCLTWQTCSINRVLMQTWAQKSLNTIFLNILTAFYSLSAFLFFNTGFFRVGVNLVCFTNIYFVQLVPHNVYWAWC